MPISISILNLYRFTHQHILSQVERATDEEFFFRPSPSVHSMAFTLWHLGRWADHFRSRLPAMTPAFEAKLGRRPDMWIDEKLAEKWGFPVGELGLDQTGTLMDDSVAASIQLPQKAVVIDYVRRSFVAAEEALALVGGDQYLEINRLNPEETVLDAILRHILHEGRHLGEMEYLLGLQGEKGTATR